METSQITSFIGGFIFFMLMAICFRYASGKWNVAENKKDGYQLWTEKHGTKVKRAIVSISIIYGFFMLIQIIELV